MPATAARQGKNDDREKLGIFSPVRHLCFGGLDARFVTWTTWLIFRRQQQRL